MLYLRQSTASQSVLIGPFVDSTDGNTAETALTIANTDIRVSKNGGNIVAKTLGGGTHDELGYYAITLDATDTNTVGRLQIMVHVAGALPVYHEFQVLEEAVYDAMYASGAVGPLEANDNGAGLTEAGGTGDHLTAINLPNQTMDITGNITGNLSGSVGSVTGAVGSVTGNVGGNVSGSVGSVTGAINTAAGVITTLDGLDTAQDTQHSQTQTDIAALNDIAVSDILTTQMTESYAANGTAPTLAQGVFAIHQMLMEFAISGVSYTVKKLDSTTTAFVVTLDDATSPTSATR